MALIYSYRKVYRHVAIQYAVACLTLSLLDICQRNPLVVLIMLIELFPYHTAALTVIAVLYHGYLASFRSIFLPPNWSRDRPSMPFQSMSSMVIRLSAKIVSL